METIASVARAIHRRWATPEFQEMLTPQMKASRLPMAENLRLLGSSYKIRKNGTMTFVIYMAPAETSGRNMCAWKTIQCVAGCLGLYSGQLVFSSARNSEIWKAALWFYARDLFERLLCAEIRSAMRVHRHLAIRIDGSSDTGFSQIVAPLFGDVQFYDYTKSPNRYERFLKGLLPKNIFLTFSYGGHGTNEQDCYRFLAMGGNVAVPFARGAEIPSRWWGFPVIDGDETDYRVDDPPGHVVGLTWKGIKSGEGFAVDPRTAAVPATSA